VLNEVSDFCARSYDPAATVALVRLLPLLLAQTAAGAAGARRKVCYFAMERRIVFDATVARPRVRHPRRSVRQATLSAARRLFSATFLHLYCVGLNKSPDRRRWPWSSSGSCWPSTAGAPPSRPRRLAPHPS
jgi:hypothetical protein